MSTTAVQSRNTVPVEVKISLDPKTGQLVISPDRIRLKTALRNEIQLRCFLQKTQKIEITFDAKDSPFRNYRLLFKGNSTVLSGVPRQEKARARPYQCTVRVLNPEATTQSAPAAILPAQCFVTVE